MGLPTRRPVKLLQVPDLFAYGYIHVAVVLPRNTNQIPLHQLQLLMSAAFSSLLCHNACRRNKHRGFTCSPSIFSASISVRSGQASTAQRKHRLCSRQVQCIKAEPYPAVITARSKSSFENQLSGNSLAHITWQAEEGES